MQRTIAIAGIAAASFGFVSPVLAQTESTPSPAELLGVQERSIQTDSKATRRLTPVDSGTGKPYIPSYNEGTVLYRIDRNTRVLVGPARGTNATADLPDQSQQGDNRLQLLHDLEE